jgi:DNA oxidative demethylase
VKSLNLYGVEVFKAFLDRSAQERIVEDIREVVQKAPLFSPRTPWGKPMSVSLTAAGKYGWFSDRKGYRYIDHHPSGVPWPPIPASVLAIWRAYGDTARMPECCLINFYNQGARMGLHQDKDEKDFSYPVVSVSLGDSALFRIGGTKRTDPTSSIWLESGDVALLKGVSRLNFHGIDRIKSGSSTLLSSGGRLNLTLRVVE